MDRKDFENAIQYQINDFINGPAKVTLTKFLNEQERKLIEQIQKEKMAQRMITRLDLEDFKPQPFLINTDFLNNCTGWMGVSLKAPKITKFLIPNFIGIKENEITLVWSLPNGGKETTKAVRSDEDSHNFIIGFLVAYYKRVHKSLPNNVLRNKIVEIFKEFPQGNIENYFATVYFEHCGLDIESARRYLKYINNRSNQETIITPHGFLTREEKGEK